VAGLIDQALAAFEEAEQALAEGNLGGYQDATTRAADLLGQAQELTGGVTPEPPEDGEGPEPTPAPG
jgi:hypothetical protein